MQSKKQLYTSGIDTLKATAIVAAIIDHAGLFFMPEEKWLRVAGRYSAPIFFFLAGFNGSGNQKKITENKTLMTGILITITGDLLWNRENQIFLADTLIMIAAAKWTTSGSKKISAQKMAGYTIAASMLYYVTAQNASYGLTAFFMAAIGKKWKESEKKPERKNWLLMCGTAWAAMTINQTAMKGWSLAESVGISAVIAISLVAALKCSKTQSMRGGAVTKILSKHTLLIYFTHIGIMSMIKQI